MDIVPYSSIPGSHHLSSTGWGRARLISQEYDDGVIDFETKISVGDQIGANYPLISGYYSVKKIHRPRSIENVDVTKMNQSGIFMVLCRTQKDALRLIELSLVI